MEIDGFARYDMYKNYQGSILDYEGKIRTFSNILVDKKIRGSSVLNFIGEQLCDKDCCGMHIDGDRIIFDFINAETGGCDTLWVRFIKEVEK